LYAGGVTSTRHALSAEETRFLQRRVALFGLVGTVLAGIALLLSIAQSAAEPGPLLAPSHALHVLGMLGPFAAWIVARKRAWSARFLQGLEAGATLACAVFLHLMSMRFEMVSRPDLLAALVTMQIVVTRAIFIPSTGRRTAVISSIAAAPLFAVAFTVHRSFAASSVTLKPGLLELEISALTWAVLSVVPAALTSRVIYGLRREVRHAQELGQYTLLQKLGEGGMGQVFRARHAMLRRPTAVKLLHSSSQEELARFEREVQLTAQLTHPNTVTVFDYGRTPDGIFYYAMELLDGADLQKVVDHHGPMPAGRVIHVLAQVAAALSEAHAVGLIHRDIKPANIILCVRGTEYDVAKVVDFGLVKSVTPSLEDASVSSPGLAVGTPLYMAPETLRAPQAADIRTDLYSLGAVGHFLLTGRPVFEGRSPVAVLSDHLHKQPERPSVRLGAPVPHDLEELILECLAKTPSERPRDASIVRQRLLACAGAEPWTEHDARAWWSSRGVTIASKHEPVSSSAKTIAVDFGERTAAP